MEIACNAMEIAAKQTLCEDEASLEAGLEAMEIATWLILWKAMEIAIAMHLAG